MRAEARHNIEFLWGWLDALRRRDTATMAAALHAEVVWQGIRPELACNGPDDVVETYVSGYADNQKIEAIEVLGGESHVVVGVRGPDMGKVNDIEIGSELYNVFTIEEGKIARIEDYLRRDEALAAAGLD